MKSLVRALVFVALAFGMSVPGETQVNQHFFPVRPRHVTLLHDIGVLIGYGAGNDTAGLAIRRSDGKLVHFFMAFPTQANGRRFNVYSCNRRPDCSPPGIRLNKTLVRVTYWVQKAPWGTSVKVSDTIDTLQ